jgi:hypothetical protein
MSNGDQAFNPVLIEGKDLERHFALQEAMVEFARLFRDELNDRAMVIVGAAFLDTQLEHIIKTFLVDDEKEIETMLRPDQSLGTYGGKTRLAYCLGLIGANVRNDLRLIGKIRNKFAHDLYASFANADIQSWVSSLTYHRISYMTPPEGAATRDLFNVGLNRVAGYLSGIVSVARYEKLTIRNDG